MVNERVTAAPTLTDGRVVLDALRPDDEAAFVGCYDHAVAWAWFDTQAMTPARAADQIHTARAHWRRGSSFRRFAIREASSPRLVGTLHLHPKPRGGSVLEVWLCPGDRRAGIGTASVALAVGYAFEAMTVEWVEVEVRPENAGAVALARAAGFEPVEGQIRQMATGEFVAPYRLSADRWRERALGNDAERAAEPPPRAHARA